MDQHAVQSRAPTACPPSTALGAQCSQTRSRGRAAGHPQGHVGDARLGQGPASRRKPCGDACGCETPTHTAHRVAQAGARARRTAAPLPYSLKDQPRNAQKQHPTPPARNQPPAPTRRPTPTTRRKPFSTMYTLHDHAGPPGYMGRGLQARQARKSPGPARIGAPRYACRGVCWSLMRALHEHATPLCSCWSLPANKDSSSRGSAQRSSSAQLRWRSLARLPRHAASPPTVRKLSAHALPHAGSGGSAHWRRLSIPHQCITPGSMPLPRACARTIRRLRSALQAAARQRSAGLSCAIILDALSICGLCRQRRGARAGAQGGPPRLTSRQTGRRPRPTG